MPVWRGRVRRERRVPPLQGTETRSQWIVRVRPGLLGGRLGRMWRALGRALICLASWRLSPSRRNADNGDYVNMPGEGPLPQAGLEVR